MSIGLQSIRITPAQEAIKASAMSRTKELLEKIRKGEELQHDQNLEEPKPKTVADLLQEVTSGFGVSGW